MLETALLKNHLYECCHCHTPVTQYKSFYWECQCTRIGIYADVDMPSMWQPRQDARLSGVGHGGNEVPGR